MREYFTYWSVGSAGSNPGSYPERELKWIVESLDDLSEEEIEALWADEAERRLDEMEQGQVKEIPAKEVLRRARTVIS